MSEERIAELDKQIGVLKDMPGMESNVKGLEAERDRLVAEGTSPKSAAAKGPTPKGKAAVAAEVPEEDMLWTEATEDEYQKADSLFPKPGRWPVEFGIPSLYETGTSLMWPFTVLAPAPFEGREDFIWTATGAKGVFKLKEILEAIGVPYALHPTTGKVGFNPAAVAGKKAKIVYVVEGTYEDADGVTKPSAIAKAKSVIALDAETSGLGI